MMMECSWKVLLLLVFASLGIQYTAIKSIRMNFISPCRSVTAENRCGNIKGLTADNAHQSKNHTIRRTELTVELRDRIVRRHRENAARVFCEDENGQESRKHILILATARSGSSFLGQLFNQNSDVFYLYEPLYHVQGMFSNANGLLTLDRRSLLGAYRDLLHNLYDCDFYLLENYIKPAPKDHVTSSLFRSGASKALCSPPVCSQSQEFDESKCFTLCRKINLTLASTSCRFYKTMAIKTIRIPEINHMRTLVEDPRLNLKIVHLVRDPRAVLASRLSTFRDIYRSYHIWNSSGRKPHNIDLSAIRNMCMDYSNSVETVFSRPSWLRGKYMLVRHEDLAKDPIKKTKEIYNFVGLQWKEGLSAWIEENTNATVPPNPHKYSTIRKSAETVENWRLHLHFSIVQTVQTICNTTLSQLGYQMVDSIHQLRNLSHSLVEPRAFLPFI